MQTTHQIVLTDDYIAEAQRMAIAQNTLLRLLYQTWWARWVPRALIATFALYCFLNHLESSAALMAGFLALSFVGEIIGRVSLARARKRTRFKGSTSTFCMSDAGVDVLGANGHSHLKWPVMLKPAIYSNGVLVKLSRISMVWLPDQSLIEGSPADVRQLLADNVKDAAANVN